MLQRSPSCGASTCARWGGQRPINLHLLIEATKLAFADREQY